MAMSATGRGLIIWCVGEAVRLSVEDRNVGRIDCSMGEGLVLGVVASNLGGCPNRMPRWVSISLVLAGDCLHVVRM